VPRQHSSGGHERLGGITKMGHAYLRRLLISGAQAVLLQAARNPAATSPWLARLLREKPRKVGAVALANKTARIVWKLMLSGARYDRERAAAGRRAARVHQGDGRHPPSATAARRGRRASDGGSEGMASRSPPAIIIGGATPREA
jgi:hypothetical protein